MAVVQPQFNTQQYDQANSDADGKNISTFSSWVSVTENDRHSIKVDSIAELFKVNLKNFTPTKNSPLKQNALSIKEYNMDLNGKIRLILPSIGAIDH